MTKYKKDVIEYLSERMTSEEKAAALKEAAESTDWVYNYIKKICEDKQK